MGNWSHSLATLFLSYRWLSGGGGISCNRPPQSTPSMITWSVGLRTANANNPTGKYLSFYRNTPSIWDLSGRTQSSTKMKWEYSTSEKMDLGFWDSIAIPHRDNFEHMKGCAAVYHVSCSDYRTSTVVMVDFSDIWGQVMQPCFSPHQSTLIINV